MDNFQVVQVTPVGSIHFQNKQFPLLQAEPLPRLPWMNFYQEAWKVLSSHPDHDILANAWRYKSPRVLVANPAEVAIELIPDYSSVLMEVMPEETDQPEVAPEPTEEDIEWGSEQDWHIPES